MHNIQFKPIGEVLAPTTTCSVCFTAMPLTRKNRKYCSFACLKKAERERLKAQAEADAAKRKESPEREAEREEAQGWIFDPTVEELNAWATLLRVDGERTQRPKGKTFVGTMPEWTPPEGDFTWEKGVNDSWKLVYGMNAEMRRMGL